MGLLERIKEVFRTRQKTAAEQYIELLCRVDTEQTDDVDQLASVMDTLGRTPANLEGDADVIRRAVELRERVRRIPELAHAYARDVNERRLIDHRCERAIKAARSRREQELAEVKAKNKQQVTAFYEAKQAYQHLQAMLPKLCEVLGNDDGFVNLIDPAQEAEAHVQGKAWLQSELKAEGLTTA